MSWVLNDGSASNSLSTPQVETVSIAQPAQENLFGTVTHDVTSPGGDIYSLYEAILGRAPDPLGLEFWTSPAPGRRIAQLPRLDVLASPEYTQKYGFFAQSSDTGFVTQLYENGVHRAPDPSGLAFWDNALESGATRQLVAVDIALSKEEQSDLAPTFQTGVFVPSETDAEVARLYYGILDRPPDASGLAFWENAVNQGVSLTSIATDMINSPEYATEFGQPSNAQFVNALFEGALERPADALAELAFTAALSLGVSRGTVAVAISESPEAANHLSSQIESGFKLA